MTAPPARRSCWTRSPAPTSPTPPCSGSDGSSWRRAAASAHAPGRGRWPGRAATPSGRTNRSSRDGPTTGRRLPSRWTTASRSPCPGRRPPAATAPGGRWSHSSAPTASASAGRGSAAARAASTRRSRSRT